MADISFNIARKELKIAQIAQLYQLFRLLHLIYIYSHGFYELSRMLMRKKVNNDVSKDSPIQFVVPHFSRNTCILRVTVRYVLHNLVVMVRVKPWVGGGGGGGGG